MFDAYSLFDRSQHEGLCSRQTALKPGWITCRKANLFGIKLEENSLLGSNSQERQLSPPTPVLNNGVKTQHRPINDMTLCSLARTQGAIGLSAADVQLSLLVP